MTEQKRKRVVYAVFVAAVVFGLVMRPWENRRIRTTAVSAPVVPVEPTVTTVMNSNAIDYVSDWPSNPFEEFDPEGAATSDENNDVGAPWRVQGFMVLNGESVCVLNGLTYSRGDRIEDWTIDLIDLDKGIVGIRRGERRLELTMD